MGVAVSRVWVVPATMTACCDYLSGEDYEAVAERFPAGRWGMPDDPARLIAWLATDEGEWVTGQVIDSEGGFRR